MKNENTEHKLKLLLTLFIILSLGLSIFSVFLGVEASNRAMETSNSYRQALWDVAESVENVALNLEKCRYASSPYQLTSLSSMIWRECGTAKTNLEHLPIDEGALAEISSYFAKAGDFIYSIAKEVSAGNALGAEDEETINALKESAALLSERLRIFSDTVEKENYSCKELIKYLSAVFSIEGEGGAEEPVSLTAALDSYPTLIYDGVYSEHIAGMVPAMLVNRETVSFAQAYETLLSAFNIKDGEIERGRDLISENYGLFSLTSEKHGINAYVTMQGGFIYSFSRYRQIGAQTLSTEEAIALAKNVLDKIGYTDMEENYYMNEGGILTVNFAWVKDGVTFYTDLIKVGVALDTGEIVSVDAHNYLMMHSEDADTSAAISEDEAKEKVTKAVEITSSRLATIPTAGKNKVLCYEFKTKASDGTDIIFYIDAKNGIERDILILIENENGVLTQ